MRRREMSQKEPTPGRGGSWLAGLVIGSAIMTMATGAMVMGAGAALKQAGVKGLSNA